ncbi:MAG: hypothetical protein HQL47_09675 [Gammaproteobacteria bacterium]|nr:hypothetical protein [Gammaproteobacteria bacterium]
MQMTHHAHVRMQQRGIDSNILAWLQQFGRRVHDGSKATLVHFDRRGRDLLRRQIPEKTYARLEKKLDAYLVEIEGQVVTVGRRYRRIHHH